MENNKYSDKVVEFLVRDTKMDYDEGKIYYPFLPPDFFSSPSLPILSFLTPSFSFSEYSKNVYGLTSQEIGYVCNQYKDIILDKINNGK